MQTKIISFSIQCDLMSRNDWLKAGQQANKVKEKQRDKREEKQTKKNIKNPKTQKLD